jgi:hypothetical protein
VHNSIFIGSAYSSVFATHHGAAAPVATLGYFERVSCELRLPAGIALQALPRFNIIVIVFLV